MKRHLPLFAAVLFAVTPALAHEDHGKARHGGVVADAATFQAELVAQPDRITIYVSEHGKPLATAGGSAKLTLLAGGQRTEVVLPPAGDDRFAATGSFKVQGAKAVATVGLAGQPAKTLRFTLR